MFLKELLLQCDEIELIARAIFEDNFGRDRTDYWIHRYYAHLVNLKNSEIGQTDYMLYYRVVTEEGELFGDVCGITYEDILSGTIQLCGIAGLREQNYASLYVPKHSIQAYGAEVVASEALREYGNNGYEGLIICPDDICQKVHEALETMTTKITPSKGKPYFNACLQEYCQFIEDNLI